MTYSQLMSTYMGVGTLAGRPASPNVATGVAAFYYATDTSSLYAWDGSAWHTITSGGGGAGVTQSLLFAQSADNSGISAGAWAAWPNLSASITVTAGARIRARVYVAFQASASADLMLRLVIDGVAHYVGGAWSNSGNTTRVTGVCESGSLSAGTYAVALEYQNGGGSIYCRPISASPADEFCALEVEELH